MKSKARLRLCVPDDKVASTTEAREAIMGLTEADYVKLMLVARSFVRTRIRGTIIQAEDILHDAIVKTLQGKRRWKKGVPLIKHLDRVMESDAGHVAEKSARHITEEIYEDTFEIKIPNQEVRVAALNELQYLLDLFSKDKPSIELIRLKGDGYSAREIQQKLGIGKVEYETVNKRIRRRLAQQLVE